MLEYNHMFEWDNVQILDRECNYLEWLMSEMIHIKAQRDGFYNYDKTIEHTFIW